MQSSCLLRMCPQHLVIFVTRCADWLDANIEPSQPKTAKAVAKKIAIDQLVYAPIFTCVLYSFLQFAHGDAGSIPEVLQVWSCKHIPFTTGAGSCHLHLRVFLCSSGLSRRHQIEGCALVHHS